MLSLTEEDEQQEREGNYLEDPLSKKQKMSVEDDDDNQQGEGKEQEKLDDEDYENEHDPDEEDQDEEQTEEAKSITKYNFSLKWRCSTKEEKRNYNIMVKNSKGFDVGDVLDNVYDLPIRPVRLDLFPNKLKNLEKLSKAALENYNGDENNKIKYKFVKFVRANCWNRRENQVLFITFKAEEMAGSQPMNFQARVCFSKNERKVTFCRPEPNILTLQGIVMAAALLGKRKDPLSKKQKMSVKDDDDNQQGEGKELEKLDDEEDYEDEHDRDEEVQDEEQTEEEKAITNYYSSLKWRCSTEEEKREYNIRVENSEGFDVGDVPENVYDLPIRPVRLDLFPNNLKNLEKHSKAALENYNGDENNKIKYKFVKFVRANYWHRFEDQVLFITFMAEEMAGSHPMNFQAHVCSTKDETKVKFCRPE